MNVKDGYKLLNTAIVHSLTFSSGTLSWKTADPDISAGGSIGIVGSSPGFTPSTSTVYTTAATTSQYVLTASANGTPTWNSLPANAFKNDNTTYSVVTSTANGLAPAMGTAAAATISTQASEWVLATSNGSTPTWRKLPANAFANTTYSAGTGLSLSNYAFSLKSATTDAIGGVKVSTVNTNAVSPTKATTGTNYGLTIDSGGVLYVTIPTTGIIAGTSSTAASNGSVSNSTVYINSVTNSSATGSISIKGSGRTTVSAASGAITIATTNKTLTIQTSSTASTTYDGSSDVTVNLLSLIASNSVLFLGGVASTTEITSKNTAGYGDYVRATTAITDISAHAGDVIMLNSNASGAYNTIANWVVLHTEADTNTNTYTTTGSTIKTDTNLYLVGGTSSSSTTYQTTYLSGAGAYIKNGVVYSDSKATLNTGTTLFKLNNTDKTASSGTTIYAPTSGGALGTILIGLGTTTAPAWLAAGTSGYVLRSNGSANPTWVTVTSLLSYYYTPSSKTASSLSLSPSSWTQAAALSINNGSTYAINIAVTANSVTTYASGIFTASTTDKASDEIPLHCTIPSSGIRIYAKTLVDSSSVYIYLASDSTATASVTIKYKQLI